MNPVQFDASAAPAEAYRFSAPAELFSEDAATGAKARKVRGVAYSGDVITEHGFWSRVAFDLATTTVDSRIPLLVDHDRGKRAGFASLAIGSQVDVADASLLDNAVGREVAADSDAGFPWQLSIHISPGKIQFVDAGEVVEINGRRFDGPLHVFRENRIRELSLTPVGADHRTTASVFSASAAPATPAPLDDPEPPHMITPEQFATLQADVAALTATVATVTGERDTAQAALAAAQARLDEQRNASRFAAVVSLFREVGRQEPKDPANAGAYMTLTDEQFATVAGDMRASRPQLPDALFSHTATGAEHAAPAGAMGDPVQFAAKIRATVDEARKAGRVMNEAEAAAAIRAAQPAA